MRFNARQRSITYTVMHHDGDNSDEIASFLDETMVNYERRTVGSAIRGYSDNFILNLEIGVITLAINYWLIVMSNGAIWVMSQDDFFSNFEMVIDFSEINIHKGR